MTGAMRTLAAAVLGLSLAIGPVTAQSPPVPDPASRSATGPARFASPEEGFAALAEAARRRDPAALARVLGEEGRSLLRSGDEVADAAALDRFAAAYDQKRAIERPSPDRAVLAVGEDDWPLPIPMVRRGGTWRFDARQGAQELVDRRIGRNELDTIETLRAIVDAQQEYARTAGRDGIFRAYARRFASSPGRHDGLYWETAAGAPPSPLGAFVAAASAEGYRVRQEGEAPRPINGYLFRMLEAQGPAAPGGAMSYVVDGRMIGGFAVIAWPAVYGASGIQTFMVSHDGLVWQRDLGRDTARIAERITAFDPGRGWQPVPEP